MRCCSQPHQPSPRDLLVAAVQPNAEALGYSRDVPPGRGPSRVPERRWGKKQRSLLHFAQQEALDFSPSQPEPPTPSFLSAISRGQKLVNEDWNRFKPTKAVNQSQ